MLKPRGFHNITQGNGVLHLVACHCNFQGRVRKRGRNLANWTKHDMNKTLEHYVVCEHLLPESHQVDFHQQWGFKGV